MTGTRVRIVKRTTAAGDARIVRIGKLDGMAARLQRWPFSAALAVAYDRSRARLWVGDMEE